MNETPMHPLRKLRKECNLTQRELADKTKVSEQTIMRAEKYIPISLHSRRLLCAYFQMTPEQLGLLSNEDQAGKQPLAETSPPATDERQHLIARLPHLIADGILLALNESDAQEAGGQVMDTLRRRLLQTVIALTSAPLDLDVLNDLLQGKRVIDTHSMTIYEQMLALSWESSYTSSIQHASGIVACGLNMLNDAVKHVNGMQRDHINAMLSRFYRLYSMVVRDRMDFAQAEKNGTLAIDLARELDDAELIAAALHNRSETYFRQHLYHRALTDIEQALAYADRSRAILRENIYLSAALRQTQIRGYDLEKQRQILKYLDQVERVADRGSLEEDSSFLKLNLAGVQIERAKILRQFETFKDPNNRDFKAARNAFSQARAVLSPELTSWQANILLEEAEVDLAEHDIGGCCERLLHAWKIIKAIQSPSREKRIVGLYMHCAQLEPRRAKLDQVATALGIG